MKKKKGGGGGGANWMDTYGDSLALKVKMNDLKNNMDLSRIQQPTEKDLARVERYKVEYENLLNVLCNGLEV